MTVEEKAREPLSKTEQSLCRAVGLRVSTCEMCGLPTLSSKLVAAPRTCGRMDCLKRAGDPLGLVRYKK